MDIFSKYFKSETVEVKRSVIKLASYNPRVITDEAKNILKKSLKQYGIVGGLVWNKRTSTLVSGHQKIAILDSVVRYDGTGATDYMVKVEAIDVDEETEKKMNILFNNPKAMGEYDYEKLGELLSGIDYHEVGFNEEDMNLIGIDTTMKTDGENELADALGDLSVPLKEKKKLEKETGKMNKEQRVAHNKEVKQDVLKQAEEKADSMLAYVTLSFDTYKAKQNFMRRFGMNPDDKFIKGEWLDNLIERIE